MARISMGQMSTIKDLFKDSSNYENEINKTEFSGDLPISGPYTVIDPRRVGYQYISYAFVESGPELPNISEEKEKISGLFQDNTINNGLLVGIALGDHDIIHRRTEQKQYTHAQFAVDSINDEELNYIKSIETYPIWAIARWHGKNIPKHKMFNDQSFDSVSKFEAEILYELNKDPNQEDRQIAAEIERRIKNNEVSAIDSTDSLPDMLTQRVGEAIRELENDRIILGKSIGLTVSDTPAHHVIIGLEVEEIEEDQLESERGTMEEALHRDPLPNEVLMYKIRNVFDDPWQMPYIVSGVGQGWADILVEMHISDVQEMDDHAERLRDIPGIKSTRTNLITHEAANEPLIVNNPNYFN